MERLTVKTENGYMTNDTKCMKNKYIDKLGQLEDIEEELGIELSVLFSIKEAFCRVKVEETLKSTFPHSEIKQINKTIKRHLFYIDIINKEIAFGSVLGFQTYKIKDYGKTWALTKEELEK